MSNDSVRAALRRINEVLYDYSDIYVDVTMRNGKITITADLGKSRARSFTVPVPGPDPSPGRGRAGGRRRRRLRGEAGVVPSPAEMLSAIRSARSISMTALARSYKVRPRQRLQTILDSLVKEGVIRKVRTNYVPLDRGSSRSSKPGAAKSARRSGGKVAAGRKSAVRRTVPRAPVARRGKPAQREDSPPPTPDSSGSSTTN
jgi:hypothetical protein